MARNNEVPPWRGKPTLTLSARVSEQTDNLRSELQQRLDVPLHNLIELGFRALKSQLDAAPGDGADHLTKTAPGAIRRLLICGLVESITSETYMSNFYGEHNPAFRAPITDVVARFGLRLKRQGRELVGPCPVDAAAETGSLSTYGRKFGTAVAAFAVAMPSLSFNMLKGADIGKRSAS